MASLRSKVATDPLAVTHSVPDIDPCVKPLQEKFHQLLSSIIFVEREKVHVAYVVESFKGFNGLYGGFSVPPLSMVNEFSLFSLLRNIRF